MSTSAAATVTSITADSLMDGVEIRKYIPGSVGGLILLFSVPSNATMCYNFFNTIPIQLHQDQETDSLDSAEFITIRKRLDKTQKELAELLGSSLKAVSSYEQGWRTIPGHVERQLLYLFAKKVQLKDQNCWDITRCPPEKKENCPAWEFDSGNLCWFINGTICEQRPQKTWQDKISICRQCRVLKRLLNA